MAVYGKHTKDEALQKEEFMLVFFSQSPLVHKYYNFLDISPLKNVAQCHNQFVISP
jgi:hypothetical protein